VHCGASRLARKGEFKTILRLGAARNLVIGLDPAIAFKGHILIGAGEGTLSHHMYHSNSLTCSTRCSDACAGHSGSASSPPT
jgi:hypothetical protein